VYDWALIATQFIAEYMDLNIHAGAGASALNKDDFNQRGRF